MADIKVANAAQLHQALVHAKGGEVITLASGNYGDLHLAGKTYASNVTITSAAPNGAATFSGLDLRNVSNLTLSHLVFDYRYSAGDPTYVSPFQINGGAHVTISKSKFDGDAARGTGTEADGYGYGTGLAVTGARNVHVTDNRFFNFYNGLTASDSRGVIIKGNNVHDIRSDGMDFVHVQGVTIAGNHIHDFRTNPASLDHPDMIQFWTAGTKAPSTNIVIKGNLLDAGSGPWTQSIFLGNELAGLGPRMYYRNVTISDNVVVNGHFHGITVGQAIGVSITHNSVLHTDGAAVDGQDPVVEIPQINVAPQSSHVRITHNLTGGITGRGNGWNVGQNLTVQDQDPNQPHFYRNLFISSSLTAQHGVHMFLATPDGKIAVAGAGATATRKFLPEAGSVAALFEAGEKPSGSVQTRMFDGGASLGHKGALPDTATYHWDFGDGRSANGEKVVHHFKTGGYYNVTLTVRLENGASDTTHGVIGVQNTNLLQMGGDGKVRVQDYGHTVVLPGNGSANGLQLGGGVALTVPDTFISNITRVHEFDVLMQLKASSTHSAGEVLRLNGGLTALVTGEGKLQVEAIDGAGHKILLTSGRVSMTDLRAHDIDIRATDGRLQLWVDGAIRSAAAFKGAINSFGPTDLTFGNPWGAQNFFGEVTGFAVKVGHNALGHSGQSAPAQAAAARQSAAPPHAATTSANDTGTAENTGTKVDAALTDSFDFHPSRPQTAPDAEMSHWRSSTGIHASADHRHMDHDLPTAPDATFDHVSPDHGWSL